MQILFLHGILQLFLLWKQSQQLHSFYNDRLAAGESRAELEKEYESEIASPFTAAACGAVDDIFVPAETKNKAFECTQLFRKQRETTIPRKTFS